MINVLFSAAATGGMWSTLVYGCGWSHSNATMLSIAWGAVLYYVLEFYGEER